MADKDFLHNALATSHDMHMQIIDAREDELINKARNWLNELVENLVKYRAWTAWIRFFSMCHCRDEVKRNRGKILEINHFLDIQREEFEALNSEYTPDVDTEGVPSLD